MTSPSKGTALVTGASAGIGAVYADRLVKLGYDLFWSRAMLSSAREKNRVAILMRHLLRIATQALDEREQTILEGTASWQ